MSTTPVTLDNPPPAPNLYQRIIEVRKEVSYVQKNAIIDNKYRAVSHDAVVAALRDSMNKHGVIAFPSIVTNGTVSEVTKADGTRASQFRYAGQFSVTFINADDPKDRETVFVEGHAMDNGDKAPGKASSYAFKSALLKMFLLETGENEESVFGQADGLDSVKFGDHLKKIADAANGVELTEVTAAAIAEADAANDKQAIKLIVKAKDAREASMPILIPDADFEKGMKKWQEAVSAGKKTPDEILSALASKRWAPTQEQEAAIRTLTKKETEQ